jgi:hypothetical protein
VYQAGVFDSIETTGWRTPDPSKDHIIFNMGYQYSYQIHSSFIRYQNELDYQPIDTGRLEFSSARQSSLHLSCSYIFEAKT